MDKKKVCGKSTDVYSRVTGFYRPIKNWNPGKDEERKARKVFELKKKCLN